MIVDKLLKLLNENLPTSIYEDTISSQADINKLIRIIADNQDKFVGAELHITNKTVDQSQIESMPIIKMAPGEQTDILGVYRTLIGVLEYNLRILGKLQITITNS